MQLLSIIYDSLLIFAIAAVVVIIVSYISYKIRSKRKGEKKPYQKDLDKLKTQKQKPIVKSEIKILKNSASIVKKKQIVPTHHTHHKPTKAKHHTAKKEKKEAIPPPNERIKVIKQLSNNIKSKEKKVIPKLKRKNMRSLNGDILKKYSDSSDDDLFTLKVDEDEED